MMLANFKDIFINFLQLLIRMIDLAFKMESSLKPTKSIYFRIIHLVRTQNFPKNYYFLPLNTHTHVRTYQMSDPFHFHMQN